LAGFSEIRLPVSERPAYSRYLNVFRRIALEPILTLSPLLRLGRFRF
jgi:hypothetical protein